jgi:ribosomal protein S9
MRQAKAVAHAVSRALADYNSGWKKLLKQAGFGGVRVKDSEKF